MDRRTMLQILGGAAVVGATPSYFFLNNEPMKPAPKQDGKVLCDFHAHPCKKNDKTDLVAMLGSPGLVGLAGKFIDKSGEDISLYEEAVELVKKDPSFQEITPNQLAKYREGYFARTQEIQAGMFHVLGIGVEGDYLQKYTPYSSVAAAVDAIHRQHGVAVLNHPFFLCNGGLFVKPATEEDLLKIKEGYRLTDEVEVFNAYCIDLIPGLIAAKSQNGNAQQLLKEYPTKKGMTGSDCHRGLSQVKITGNYIDQTVIDEQGIDGIKQAIQRGSFERYTADSEPYVSRGSWILGVAGDIFSALK